MTTEHLRPLLDDVRGLRLLGEVAERLARAEVPAEVIRLVPWTSLYVCQEPKALFSCVKALPLSPKQQMRLLRVSPNAFFRVSPNAFTQSETELASLAYLCSLRSRVF